MIDAARLRDELQDLVVRLEDDLREHLAEDAATDQRLRAEHAAAREARRTAQAYESWRDGELTQAAVAYVLGCVFVRFLEDNELIATPWLAGPVGPRLEAARDRRTAWFQEHPRDTDLGYLRAAFKDVARLPAMAPLFDERHNACWSVALSPDGASLLHKFWQRPDASGALVHDFSDAKRSTRFLGDLYQDLSAAVRDRYALFQTPEFVEEFILDRTLEPAIQEFGLASVTLLDPTCGSGHFLLGAFARILRKWQLTEPASKTEVLVQRTLDAIAGADLNPYAIAIARFRLVVAALAASGNRRLADARDYKLHLAVADTLLHGSTWGARQLTGAQLLIDGESTLDHVYRTEDPASITDVLGRRYHVVVGNPPYVTVKDAGLKLAYKRYGSCHGPFSLAVPFTERFFDLALPSSEGAGYVGLITANSFMKRQFGKKLVEKFLPRWDLTHVIDTSGARIPHHGTATVIIFARNRRPVDSRLRMVMGIRGELPTAEDSAPGKAWKEIVGLVDVGGAKGEFVSVADVERLRLGRHPWSIGGGGAAELKETLDDVGTPLREVVELVGFGAVTREDELYCLPRGAWQRWSIEPRAVSRYGYGEAVRDWALSSPHEIVFPYDKNGTLPSAALGRYLFVVWCFREQLWNRQGKGFKSKRASGGEYYEYSMFYPDRHFAPQKIAFAFVATSNHFILDQGEAVFNRSAPIIKLYADARLGSWSLLGLLNSSVACFWMKSVCHCKGAQGINEGAKSEKWEQFYEFSGTILEQFPLAAEAPVELARSLDHRARRATAVRPENLVGTPLRSELDRARREAAQIREEMRLLQEELDWWCYRCYGILSDDLTLSPDTEAPAGIHLGERAFEIAMAREMAAGCLTTTWFERHGATPITEIPAHWPSAYRALVERRLEAIATNANVRLIEQPEYKRRWNDEPWAAQEARALRDWLLSRMEDRRYWFAADGLPQITTCARLADQLRADRDFLSVAAIYRGREDFDLTALVVELAESDAVPFLAAYRYTPAGRRKRTVWERIWDLQRMEDAIDARTRLPEDDPEHLSIEKAAEEKARVVGDIAVPEKYGSGDFAKPTYWKLRGKLDIPKERFILYPGAERDVDTTPVIGWAGWNHIEQARALATLFVAMRETEGWPPERVAPLLAGLDEIVPWVKQWHNDLDPATGERLGDYFAAFVAEEARGLGMTLDDLRALEPQKPTRGRRPRKKTTTKQASTE